MTSLVDINGYVCITHVLWLLQKQPHQQQQQQPAPKRGQKVSIVLKRSDTCTSCESVTVAIFVPRETSSGVCLQKRCVHLSFHDCVKHCDMSARYQLLKSADVLQNGTGSASWECLEQVRRSPGLFCTYFLRSNKSLKAAQINWSTSK